MASTPSQSNVPADIADLQVDLVQLTADVAQLVADLGAPVVVVPPPVVVVPPPVVTPAVPSPLSGLKFTAQTPTSVTIDWTDVTADAGVDIYRDAVKVDQVGWDGNTNFAFITTAGAANVWTDAAYTGYVIHTYGFTPFNGVGEAPLQSIVVPALPTPVGGKPVVGIQVANNPALLVTEASKYLGAGAPVTNFFLAPGFTDPSWYIGEAGAATMMYVSVPLNLGTTTLAQITAGAEDAFFVNLGNELVAKGMATAVLRPGWESWGTWFPWGAQNSVAAYVAAFQHVVTLLRGTAGSNFKVDYCGPANAAGVAMYPGDAFCDYVSTDPYDVQAWATILGQLNTAAAFAAAHDKPFCLPEWGLRSAANSGHGDNPAYIQGMHDFIVGLANPGYFIYYDREDSALGDWPNAAALFTKLFA